VNTAHFWKKIGEGGGICIYVRPKKGAPLWNRGREWKEEGTQKMSTEDELKRRFGETSKRPHGMELEERRWDWRIH
jgi:hypothetical protein